MFRSYSTTFLLLQCRKVWKSGLKATLIISAEGEDTDVICPPESDAFWMRKGSTVSEYGKLCNGECTHEIYIDNQGLDVLTLGQTILLAAASHPTAGNSIPYSRSCLSLLYPQPYCSLIISIILFGSLQDSSAYNSDEKLWATQLVLILRSELLYYI